MKTIAVSFIGFMSILFASIQDKVFAIYVLIAVYIVSGLFARIQAQDKKAITWSKVLAKTIVYPCALLAAKSSEGFSPTPIPWVSIITGGIAAYEAGILYMNLERIFGVKFIEHIKDAINRFIPKNKNPDQEDRGD